jgi:YHS domain-containing protein
MHCRMRRLLCTTAAAALLLTACGEPPATTGRQVASAGVATINTVPPAPAPLEPPPMLVDEAPPPKPKPLHQWHVPEPIIFSPEDEKLRASLPFSPAIAMDPIDGSKISIRATTPTFEYKGKIYYFSSEESRRQFMANPAAALKGGLMRL